jgi:TIR domain
MPAATRPSAPISLFYSYSHRDEALRKKLETHLSLLKDQGVIQDWHDRRIQAGTEWDGVISENLERAKIILLLVSADFLASRYCRDIELKRAMQRHQAGTARVIPVILRPVDWHSASFGKLAALPKDGKPITSWRNRDEAFTDIARGIREVQREVARKVEPPPIRRLLPELERALAVGKLRNSALGPDVLATLRDQRDL